MLRRFAPRNDVDTPIHRCHRPACAQLRTWTGRPSTPRPLGSSTAASGILDHPHARVMTPSKLSNHPVIRGARQRLAVLKDSYKAAQFRNSRIIPRMSSCRVRLAAAGTFAWGCFRYFGGTPLRRRARGLQQKSPGSSPGLLLVVATSRISRRPWPRGGARRGCIRCSRSAGCGLRTRGRRPP